MVEAKSNHILKNQIANPNSISYTKNIRRNCVKNKQNYSTEENRVIGQSLQNSGIVIGF
jgi:hypothetical protein